MLKKIINYIVYLISREVVFLKLMILRLLVLITQVLPETPRGCRIRGYVYKPYLKKCGKNFQVALGVKLEHMNNISIGDDVYIGTDCWISGVRGGITFENEVMLGPKISMSSSNHTIIDNSYRFGPGIGKHILIKKGTWISSNCVVVAGVTIAECCLVAAGAVVTKNFRPNSIIAGVPAKCIGDNLNQL